MSAFIIAAVNNERWADTMMLCLKSRTQQNYLNNYQFKATTVRWATLWVRNVLGVVLLNSFLGVGAEDVLGKRQGPSSFYG